MINSALLVRQLGAADRDAYFQLRLRGLKAHPESFGQATKEAVARGAPGTMRFCKARAQPKATFCSVLMNRRMPR